MQTTLETLGQLERRLHVAVPIEQIEGEVRKRLANLAKTAKIAGFRPGKVPLKMIAQQYGPQVRSDVISDTVQTSFNDASFCFQRSLMQKSVPINLPERAHRLYVPR